MNRITTRLASLRTFITSSVIVLTLITSSATSNAALLPLGGIHYPVFGENDLSGGANLLATTGPLAFSTANYSGTLVSSVYNNDPTNPNGLTGLTFTYLLHNDASSPDALERITITDFGTYAVDASYQTPFAGLVAPSYVDRSGSGGTVGFSFAPFTPFGKLNPGSDSALLVLQTNSTGFFPTVASVIDGLAIQVTSYAPGIPANNLPEPGTIGLSVVGLAAVAFFARRRKASN